MLNLKSLNSPPEYWHANVKPAVKSTWRLQSDVVRCILKHKELGKRRTLRANELLYDQGDESCCFYYVESGLIEVSIIKIDGTEVVLELMGVGTICGEGAAFDKLPRFSRAAATVPSVVVEFATGDLVDAFREDGEFAMTLLKVASLKQRILASRLEHMTYREPASRLMELFERLAEVDPGSGMTAMLTHEQIASMTGTSRVTVTRTLQKLRDEGKIGFDAGKLIIRREDC